MIDTLGLLLRVPPLVVVRDLPDDYHVGTIPILHRLHGSTPTARVECSVGRVLHGDHANFSPKRKYVVGFTREEDEAGIDGFASALMSVIDTSATPIRLVPGHEIIRVSRADYAIDFRRDAARAVADIFPILLASQTNHDRRIYNVRDSRGIRMPRTPWWIMDSRVRLSAILYDKSLERLAATGKDCGPWWRFEVSVRGAGLFAASATARRPPIDFVVPLGRVVVRRGVQAFLGAFGDRSTRRRFEALVTAGLDRYRDGLPSEMTDVPTD